MKKGIIAIIALATFTSLLVMPYLTIPYAHAAEPSESHDADAMWVEPAIIDLTGVSVGYKFNVTVWINISGYCLGWQFQMLYDKSIVKSTAAGYTGTGGLRSEFFENSGTTNLFPLPPTINAYYDATRNYTLHGEAWSPMIPNNPNATGVGSLSWVEFEVIAPGPYSCVLDISTGYHPQTSKTYALNEDNVEIDPLDVWNTPIVPEFISWLPIAFLSLASFIAILGSKRKK